MRRLAFIAASLALLACGAEPVGPLPGAEDAGIEDAGVRYVYGARWIVAALDRVALCRSDLVEGTCARLYFVALGPGGFPEDWRAERSFIGARGPCRLGAIEADAERLEVVGGTAAGLFLDAGVLEFDLDVRGEDGRSVEFSGRVPIDTGPCP